MAILLSLHRRKKLVVIALSIIFFFSSLLLGFPIERIIPMFLTQPLTATLSLLLYYPIPFFSFLLLILLSLSFILIGKKWLCPNCFSLNSLKCKKPYLTDEYDDSEEVWEDGGRYNLRYLEKYRVRVYTIKCLCKKCGFYFTDQEKKYRLVDKVYLGKEWN